MLDHHTRAAYGIHEEFSPAELEETLDLATAMVHAATTWPDGEFREPYRDEYDDLEL